MDTVTLFFSCCYGNFVYLCRIITNELKDMKQCPNCRNYNEDYARFCSNCGHTFDTQHTTTPPPVYPVYNNNDPFTSGPEGKSRGVAALLAIFLGAFGVHYFYLGKTGAGLLCILLTLVSCSLWSMLTFVQGIYMLCINNEQFREKYVTTSSSFPLF